MHLRGESEWNAPLPRWRRVLRNCLRKRQGALGQVRYLEKKLMEQVRSRAVETRGTAQARVGIGDVFGSRILSFFLFPRAATVEANVRFASVLSVHLSDIEGAGTNPRRIYEWKRPRHKPSRRRYDALRECQEHLNQGMDLEEKVGYTAWNIVEA